MGTLKDTPFEMRYAELDPEARYGLRIVYSDQAPDVRVRLVADGDIEIHPWILRKVPPQQVAFDVPPEATRDGKLTLRWHREPGRGGSGRGCEISEIWLVKR